MQDYHLSTSPESLDARRKSFDSSTSPHEQRIDSGFETSPVADRPPTRTHTYTSSEGHHYVYPPLITGHGRLVRAKQTVPAWMGVLVVVGGVAWSVGCAIWV